MIVLLSATAIIKMYDAINEDNKGKYGTKTAPVMANIAFKLLK
jgi:hypothetical protein